MSKIAVLGIGLGVLMVLVLGGAYVIDAAAQNSRHDITITNESFEPTGGTVETFDNSNLERAEYDETVTVRNASDESVFDASGNYTWNSNNGTLFVDGSSDLDNTSAALITYGYEGQTAGQTAITNIAIDLNQLFPMLVLFGAVVLALGVLGVMGGLA